MKRTRGKLIRVGVVGMGRGLGMVKSAAAHGFELVALCDRWKDKTEAVCRALNLTIPIYTDYDTFLEHDMDAVMLANNFHQHAPFAVKALEAGYHVLSEIAACGTPAEGVALARAVEKSGRIYMCGETAPYRRVNLEMKRLFDAGFVGDFLYGEGEYVHPGTWLSAIWRAPSPDHWRTWMPATYYCMHGLGPLMYITGTRPEKVNGFVVPRAQLDPRQDWRIGRGDRASAILCRMDNEAIVKLLQGGLAGSGGLPCRICGSKATMQTSNECERRLMLNRMPVVGGPPHGAFKAYEPAWSRPKDLPARWFKDTGGDKGGGLVELYFAEAIRRGEQPFMDVYRGIDMSLVGIQAYRSALRDSATMEVPDFRKESVRKQYEHDDWTPDPAKRGPGQPFSSVRGEVRPTPRALALARKVWAEQKKQWQLKPWRMFDRQGRTLKRFPANYIITILKPKETSPKPAARRRRGRKG